MTDNNDDDRRSPSRGRAGKPREAGDRPARRREAKPFRARESDDRAGKGKGWPAGGRAAPPRRDGDERPRRFDRPSSEAPRRERRTEMEAAPGGPPEPAEDRIAKVIARAGVASRRDAEAMIAEGRVTLNGAVLNSPAVNVAAADRIAVDGEPLPLKERTRLWIFHKPRGLVTTARDPEGRPTVFESLPEDMPRVVAIGRLDINTEGLLLLTNDGGLAKVIAHPQTGWLRRYRVRAHGEVTQAELDALRDGITIDGMDYGPVEARIDRVQGDNTWITLGLREGKNREVKRILEHLGLTVNRLIRVSFGPFQLGELEPGLVEEVKTRVLRDQLGAALAEEAGVDFTSPVREPISPFGSPATSTRSERPEREAERPRRPDDRDERRFGSRNERGAHGPRASEAPAAKRPSRLDPKRSVWRAGEEQTEERPFRKKRADPRKERMEGAERSRERVGAIKAGEGRKVVVERLVSEPREDPALDRDGRRGPRGSAPAGDDRPRRRPAPPASSGERWDSRGPREDRASRPRHGDERPFRARSDAGERPRRGRPEGDRPFRSRDDRPPRAGDERPRRGRPEGDRPYGSRDDRPPRAGDERPRRGPPRAGDERPRRGPPRGEGPSRGPPRGGFKGGPPRGGSKGGPPRGGSKGPPRGGSKGPPRGRRP